MGKITVETCGVEGLKIITPKIFADERGYFMETYNYADFEEALITTVFVQDNQSYSRKGALRGMHYQINKPQEKLVRVISGAIFDAAIDLRVGGETFGRWFGTVLSAENKKQMYIPAGFAHGFYVISDGAEVAYKCSNLRDPSGERGILWNDAIFGIDWPIPEGAEPILSEKDKKWPLFRDSRR
jgi:dTDP-4-dehydrorhamnose 3,5-epimerase